MLIVVADDEFDFRNTAIDWIASEYEIDDEERDAAIEAVGSAESNGDSYCLIKGDKKFLIVGVLENLWDIVRMYEENNQRIIILLDLNWGNSSNALAKLQELREDNERKHYPVIIYSQSETERDIKDSYEASANGYVVKGGESPKLRKKRFIDTLNQWQGHYRPPYVNAI